MEYSAAGLVGILTPQANTTVEAELGVLVGPDVGLAVSRLTCHDDDSRKRLVGYFHNVSAALCAFDTALPETCLFACTGSSYLVGLPEEDRAFASLPVKVISAARAVLAALEQLNARRMALVSPYPGWLTEACVAFWRKLGREISEVRSPAGDRSDTRRIYDLGSAQALNEIGKVKSDGIDCILVSGTGMPTLGAIARSRTPVPVLSSNLCLAWAAAPAIPLQDWLSPSAPWRARLAARFPQAMESTA